MSAAIGALIVHAASLRGVPPDVLKGVTGFDAASAHNRDAKISLALEEQLWNEAAARSGHEAFGVFAAEIIKPGAFDVMDYAVRSAPTVRVSLDRLVRYNRLVHDVAEFSLIERSGELRIEHTFRVGGVAQNRHSAEFTIASIVTIGEQIAAARPVPLEVEFRHGRPDPNAVDLLTRFFGREPKFAQRVNSITLEAAWLERALPAADPALFRVIDRHAEALLAALPEATPSTADRVRRALAQGLGGGTTTLTEIATRLKMSERSLQRKLAAEGMSFDTLLDEMRRDLALRYLSDQRIAISEVAYLLGYSEPSPFHRAFKRWTGVTPNEARRVGDLTPQQRPAS